MSAVSPDNPASQEREVRRENPVLQDCLCQVPQDVQVLPVSRVHKGLLDLQAFPQEQQTASLESPDVRVCREREVIQERRARKVRKVRPV